MKQEFVSNSPENTEKVGEWLAARLRGGEVVAYRGGLGMGKTCFTRGLARGLGYSGPVTSPTFALINEYSGGRVPLYHFDMYRVNTLPDLESTGYFDYAETRGVLAVEWSENVSFALPDNTIFVTFERLSDTSRKITLEGEALL